MGFLVKVVLVAALGAAAWYYFMGCCPKTIPKMDNNEWWGPKELVGKQDSAIKPFKVKFDEEVRWKQFFFKEQGVILRKWRFE